MHKIKLDPLPIVTGDPDELLDLDICDTCEFATTQAARIAAICEQVKRYTVTRYIAPGRQIIVAPSTRTPGGWQVTFYHADRQTGELVPIGHADRDTAAGVADEIPYNYIAADAVARERAERAGMDLGQWVSRAILSAPSAPPPPASAPPE